MSVAKIVMTSWDYACPTGVSHIDHLRSLQIALVQNYFAAGGKGVLVAHPMVGGMLAVVEPILFAGYEWHDGVAQTRAAGHIGGIPMWIDSAVDVNEVIVTMTPSDMQPLAKTLLINFAYSPAVLDRLAQL